jgi:hypothetical protein
VPSASGALHPHLAVRAPAPGLHRAGSRGAMDKGAATGAPVPPPLGPWGTLPRYATATLACASAVVRGALSGSRGRGGGMSPTASRRRGSAQSSAGSVPAGLNGDEDEVGSGSEGTVSAESLAGDMARAAVAAGLAAAGVAAALVSAVADGTESKSAARGSEDPDAPLPFAYSEMFATAPAAAAAAATSAGGAQPSAASLHSVVRARLQPLVDGWMASVPQEVRGRVVVAAAVGPVLAWAARCAGRHVRAELEAQWQRAAHRSAAGLAAASTRGPAAGAGRRGAAPADGGRRSGGPPGGGAAGAAIADLATARTSGLSPDALLSTGLALPGALFANPLGVAAMPVVPTDALALLRGRAASGGDGGGGGADGAGGIPSASGPPLDAEGVAVVCAPVVPLSELAKWLCGAPAASSSPPARSAAPDTGSAVAAWGGLATLLVHASEASASALRRALDGLHVAAGQFDAWGADAADALVRVTTASLDVPAAGRDAASAVLARSGSGRGVGPLGRAGLPGAPPLLARRPRRFVTPASWLSPTDASSLLPWARCLRLAPDVARSVYAAAPLTRALTVLAVTAPDGPKAPAALALEDVDVVGAISLETDAEATWQRSSTLGRGADGSEGDAPSAVTAAVWPLGALTAAPLELDVEAPWESALRDAAAAEEEAEVRVSIVEREEARRAAAAAVLAASGGDAAVSVGKSSWT